MSFTGMCLLLECMKYHLLELEQKRNFPSPRTRLRTPPKVFLHDSFFFVCLFVFKNLSKLQQSQVLLVVAGHTDGAILSSVECYDFETDGVLWRKYPLEKPGIPLLSLSFLIAHFPFIFVFQILALKYLLLMDVCMQFVDQMESVA